MTKNYIHPSVLDHPPVLKFTRCKYLYLLGSASSHSLEALIVCLMNLWDLKVVFLQLVDELGGVKLAVRTTSLDNLGLLFESKVLPGEIWTDVLLEQSQDLVVRDGTRVGEVVDTRCVVLGQDDRGWEEIVKDSVGVGDIDNALVLGNLGYEVTAVKIVRDWHSQSKDEAVGVVLEDLKIIS